MRYKVSEIAKWVNGTIVGDKNVIIEGLASIEECKQGDISFVSDKRFIPLAKKSKASALIVNERIEGFSGSQIVVEHPYLVFTRLVEKFIEKRQIRGIDKTARISPSSEIEKDASIGAFCIIEDNVFIGEKSVVFPHVFIGKGSFIGKNVTIYPNVSILEKSRIGNNVIIHSGTVIGSDGFGFITKDNKHYKIPQIGYVQIENDVEIGANVTIDRATLGKTVVGEGTKIDNLVQIAHNVQIGKNCLIAAQVGIAGSTIIEDNVKLAGQAGIVGHIKIERGCIVAAQAGVTHSLKKNIVVSGYPAREHKLAKRLNALISKLPQIYNDINKLKNFKRKKESSK